MAWSFGHPLDASIVRQCPLMQRSRPVPRHTKAQSWHTQSELVTYVTQHFRTLSVIHCRNKKSSRGCGKSSCRYTSIEMRARGALTGRVPENIDPVALVMRPRGLPPLRWVAHRSAPSWRRPRGGSFRRDSGSELGGAAQIAEVAGPPRGIVNRVRSTALRLRIGARTASARLRVRGDRAVENPPPRRRSRQDGPA